LGPVARAQTNDDHPLRSMRHCPTSSLYEAVALSGDRYFQPHGGAACCFFLGHRPARFSRSVQEPVRASRALYPRMPLGRIRTHRGIRRMASAPGFESPKASFRPSEAVCLRSLSPTLAMQIIRPDCLPQVHTIALTTELGSGLDQRPDRRTRRAFRHLSSVTQTQLWTGVDRDTRTMRSPRMPGRCLSLMNEPPSGITIVDSHPVRNRDYRGRLAHHFPFNARAACSGTSPDALHSTHSGYHNSNEQRKRMNMIRGKPTFVRLLRAVFAAPAVAAPD